MTIESARGAGVRPARVDASAATARPGDRGSDRQLPRAVLRPRLRRVRVTGGRRPGAHPDGAGVRSFVVLFTLVWYTWLNGTLYHDLHGSDDGRSRTYMFVQMLLISLISVYAGEADRRQRGRAPVRDPAGGAPGVADVPVVGRAAAGRPEDERRSARRTSSGWRCSWCWSPPASRSTNPSTRLTAVGGRGRRARSPSRSSAPRGGATGSRAGLPGLGVDGGAVRPLHDHRARRGDRRGRRRPDRGGR